MTSYFKYTNGGAFTLNGIDYNGFFNVIDNIAYTGKTTSSYSSKLTPTDTFISEIYLKKLEFDNTIDNLPKVSNPIQSKFDIFTKSGLEQSLSIVDSNNLNIYKSLIIQNPSFYDFNTMNIHFYGLSSTNSDMRNDDIPIGRSLIYTQIDPFSFDSDWNFLDDIKSASFSVDSNENFYYYCTDSNNIQYTLQGSFVDPSVPLKLINTTILNNSKLLDIDIDDIDMNVFHIYQDKLEIFEYENYINCNVKIKKDEIAIANNPEFVKIGNNIRLELTDKDMFIKNKYSNDIYYNTSLASLLLGKVITCAIRKADDFIAIISIKNNKYYISFIDSEIPNIILNESELMDFEPSMKFTFSDSDSNIFITAGSTTLQKRLITYPKYAVSSFGLDRGKQFKYLNDYIWGSCYEQFDKIQIKWNSNALKSNSYNNILFNMKTFGTTTYTIIHNVGRIYVMKNNDADLLYKIDPKLKKTYKGVECSSSSFGLFLNNSLKNIVTDVLSIYTTSSCKITRNIDGVSFINLKNIDIPVENMFMNGNEQMNVNMLSRIFDSLVEIQTELI